MQEIEIVEDTQEQVRLIELVPELRNRYFETFEPIIDSKVLKRLSDALLIKTRLSTKSDLPEINVNNGISILQRIGYKYIVGINIDDVEEHRIILPFNINIDAIKNGNVKYRSAWSADMLFRPLYVKIESPIEKIFELHEMSAGQANKFWSWAVSKIDDIIIAEIARWSTYTSYKAAPPAKVITDSEFLRISTELGEITGRSFLVPADIFAYAMSMVGYGHFADYTILGKDTEPLFAALRHEISEKNMDREVRTQSIKDTYDRSLFMYYSHDRLPAEKFKNLLSRSSPGMTAKQLAELLDTKDAMMITKAIEDDRRKVDAMANNKCPHRKLVASIAKENIAEDKMILMNDLVQYLPEDRIQNDIHEEALITCTKCKYPLMCPHEFIMQQGLARRQNMKEIKDQINQYIYPDKVQGNFVCRICGQVILSISAFDNVVDQYEFSSAEEDPEVSALWSEVSYMTRYVVFENLVNRNSFISAIVSLIWPLLQSRTSQIMSSRGSSAEELVAKKRINNAMYIMAAFINLSVTSRMSSDKNTVKVSLNYPEDTQGKDHNAKMFNFAVNVIFDSLSVHIRRVPGLSKQMLVSDIIAAYRNISERKRGPIIQVYDESGNTDSWLNNSWFYYMSKHILKQIDQKSIAGLLDKIAPYRDIDTGSPKAAKKRNTIKTRQFERKALNAGVFKLSMPHMTPEEFRKKYLPEFSAKIPKEVFLVDPLWKCFAGLWQKYYDASFSLMTHYMADIYPNSAYENGRENAVMAEFNRSNDLSRLRNYEAAMLRVVRYLNAKYCHPIPDKNRYYIRTVSPLGYIYRPDGSRRVWNRYAAWVRKGKTWTLDNEIKYEYKFPANAENPWVDSTGYKYGDPIPDDSAIIEAIRAREGVINMVKFYEFICPKGDSHTFEHKKCSKCGYIQGAKSDEVMKKYYDEYIDAYDRDQSLIVGQVQGIDMTVLKLPQKKPVTVKPLDFNLVIEAAKFCKITPNAIASIGAYEGATLKAIQDNKFTAPVTTNKMASRPDKIRAACISILSRYGSFVNIATNYNPSKELTELLNDIRVPKDIMSIREFADDFIENYDTVFYNNSSKELVDFVLTRFVEMILKLRDILDKHKSIGPIVDWILEGAFEAERMGTKPIITNWTSIIKAHKDEGDLNTDDSMGPAKELDEDAEAADFGDGLDLEDDDSRDIDGDEGNQIKVRGYALD